jgi:AraC-like DNA-binding protein
MLKPKNNKQYSPVSDGIINTGLSILRRESKPESDLSNIVHNFWELKTLTPLNDDFILHAILDGCINILFNLVNTSVAGVTAIETKSVELNLGKEFHYVGIQFYPGVWCGDKSEIQRDFVNLPYTGSLQLLKIIKKLVNTTFEAKQNILNEFVHNLLINQIVIQNAVTSQIFHNVSTIYSVTDMAKRVNLSARQLQRIIKTTTGITPSNLLKVLKLQRSFKEHYANSYTDQSHYIHSFQEATGYTPSKFKQNFDV